MKMFIRDSEAVSEMTCSCVMFSHVKKRKFGVCGNVQKFSEKKFRGNEDSDEADNENQDSGRTGAATTRAKLRLKGL
jgi:hypothetical protein